MEVFYWTIRKKTPIHVRPSSIGQKPLSPTYPMQAAFCNSILLATPIKSPCHLPFVSIIIVILYEVGNDETMTYLFPYLF